MEGKEDLLTKFRVGTLPNLYYIPDFITDTVQNHLLNNIYNAPVSKWKTLKNRRLQNWGGVVHEKGLLSQDLPPWLTKITQRIFDESGLFPSAINHVLINEYLPGQGIMPHQDGPAYFPVVAILSLGSPAVMDFNPHSRLKLCTNTKDNDFDGGDFENDNDKWLENHHPFSVLLIPCSLLIFKDAAYSEYLHSIKDTQVQQYIRAVNVNEASELHLKLPDQLPSGSEKTAAITNIGELKSIHRITKRISLTCRLVLKVALFSLCMGGIMYYLEYEPDTMAPFLRGLVRRFLASRISNPGSSSTRRASYTYLQTLDAMKKKPKLQESREFESSDSEKYNLESIPGL